MFAHLGAISPPAILAAPVNALDKTGMLRMQWPDPALFVRKPYPVNLQQFAPNSGNANASPPQWF